MRPRRAILGVVLGRRFDGKVCVVNGAASTIGEAVTERFAREGAKTIGVDRVNHAVGDLALSAGLVNESQVEAMYQRIVDRFGRLDVIYNDVGLMDRGDRSALSTDLDTWHRVQEADLTAVFLCCKHGIKHLQGTEPSGGAVVNAASFLADIGAATAQMGYAAAKAAVVQFSRDLGRAAGPLADRPFRHTRGSGRHHCLPC
jgi:NAD(P)-dependent dehydrogenase (short-subunit alcohol dehydrogenase family)